MHWEAEGVKDKKKLPFLPFCQNSKTESGSKKLGN